MITLVRSYNRQQGITAVLLLIVGLLASCTGSSSGTSGTRAQDTATVQSSASPSPEKTADKTDATTPPATTATKTVTAPPGGNQRPAENDTEAGTANGGDAQKERPKATTSKTPSARPTPVKANIGLSNNSVCDSSDNGVLYVISTQNWQDGPYTTHAAYSTTLNGPYTTYNNIDYPDNPSSDASPRDGWKWPCFNDPPGFYRLWFTEMGTNTPKSETVSFQVIS